MWGVSLSLAGLLLCLLSSVEGNCKTQDVEWTVGKGPVITQPDRSNPGKIKIDWTSIANNGRCADKYFIWIWDNTVASPDFAPNFTVPEGTFTKEVNLESCVEYNFKIGYFENDLFNKERKNSSVSVFKTEAAPTLNSVDPKLFTVSFHYDYIRRITDLSKASIRFPKSVIKNTSCLKHIEVIGIPIPTSSRSARGYMSRFPSEKSLISTGLDKALPGGSGSFGASGGSGNFVSSSGTSGGSGSFGTSGGSGSLGTGGGSGSFGTSGGSGSFGTSGGSGSSSPTGTGTFGGISYGLPGNIASSFGSSYRELANIPSYPGHDHSIGKHGRGDWHSESNTLHPRNKRSPVKTTVKSPAIPTTTKPIYTPPVATSTTLGQAKVSPPFLSDFIEITIPIKPCSSYKFTVNFVSPKGSTMGSVKDLELPQLADMADYHPPSLRDIFKVSPGIGVNSEPQITLYPNTGVPIECVPAFLEAVDRHMGHLEDEVRFHTQEEFRMQAYANFLTKQLIDQKQSALKTYGCKCLSNMIHFNTSSPDQLKEHLKTELFGEFFFEGLHNGRPYYRRPSSNAAKRPDAVNAPGTPPLDSKARTKRFIGDVRPSSPAPSYSQATSGISRSSSSSSSSSLHTSSSSSAHSNTLTPTPFEKRQPSPSNNKVYFIYWNVNEKSWWVGEELDGKKPFYKTNKDSLAQCPADPGTAKQWTAPHTFSWKVDANMKSECTTVL